MLNIGDITKLKWGNDLIDILIIDSFTEKGEGLIYTVENISNTKAFGKKIDVYADDGDLVS